jgi:phosphoglycolate phosphatase-like HAD superfamily hydrolase
VAELSFWKTKSLMHLVLFDIDGTLLASGGAGVDAMFDAFDSELGVVTPRDAVSFGGRTDRGIVGDLLALHGKTFDELSWDGLMARYLSKLEVYLHRQPGMVLPGVTALLNQLSGRSDVGLGLLTGNCESGARIKLSHYQLLHFFAFGGFGDHNRHRNEVAFQALEQARAHYSRQDFRSVWVIGDTPHDITCARHIGAKSLAVATGTVDKGDLAQFMPDLLFDDLRDWKRFLASL